MHHTCWPTFRGMRLVCECKEFTIIASRVTPEDAKRAYREHVQAVVEREANRWHQEPT